MQNAREQKEIEATLDSMSLDEARAMAATGAMELARRWLPSVPGANDHVAAGAGLIVEVTLRPSLVMRMLLIDSDGKRYQLASCDYSTPPLH